MEKTVYFPPKSGPLHDRWRAWLHDNGVTLRRVVRDTPVWVEGDKVTVVEFVLDERGNRVFHERECSCEHGEGHLAKRRATHQIRVPLGEWANLDAAQDERSWADPKPTTLTADVSQGVRAFHQAFSDMGQHPPRREDPPPAGVGAGV